jgi:hypothetical protein
MEWVINPEWLKASHLMLLSYPGAPSFEEQIQADRDAQAKALRMMRRKRRGKAVRYTPRP